ncbi:Uma2 family endonuclease [Nodosilinea sp. LEGE 06152]|uniref:Uma2 family endonuclease n=1 Tax=Nodosilinea sp. LEGE 06152 TaxID=2777966 RepID=UPI00187EF00F|nr:Uma2 family endonuclease [Nodosilinea sp. LEGE 06152]MBE9158252.1 Uma2 family endonuclease [Nodosilinea sp. LEGE 06152]
MTATSSAKTASQIPQDQWYRATWADYVALRDRPSPDRIKLAFNEGWLWVTMGAEGISHAAVSDLFTSLLFFWAIQHPNQAFSSLGRCLLERAEVRASAPDLVLYVGADYPQWQPEEPRQIDLDQTRVPDLVGEISDITLASDLDEKKHLYAALGVPEYWVVDVRGQRVFAFLLQENGEYLICDTSQALAGLPIALLDETLQKLAQGTNTSAAAWLSQQMTTLSKEQP